MAEEIILLHKLSIFGSSILPNHCPKSLLTVNGVSIAKITSSTTAHVQVQQHKLIDTIWQPFRICHGR